jgi:hypothetical protein
MLKRGKQELATTLPSSPSVGVRIYKDQIIMDKFNSSPYNPCHDCHINYTANGLVYNSYIISVQYVNIFNRLINSSIGKEDNARGLAGEFDEQNNKDQMLPSHIREASSFSHYIYTGISSRYISPL